MNISSELLDQQLNSLSGGQKSKVAFAKLLYSKPEIILLDEPTNHLDKESKDFVVNYLKNYKGNVYIISHDIDFLNEVTTKTMYLDKRTGTINLYDGNYDNFKKMIVAYEESLKRQAEIQERETQRLKAFIDKYASSSGKRKRMVHDREKKLSKLMEAKIDIPIDQKKVNIDITVNEESADIPIKIKNVFFKYNKSNNQNIIDDLSFELRKGERFLIVGPNGAGKSTLLKLIVGELQPDSGTIEIHKKTSIGYYAQEHELLDNDKDIISNFSDIDITERKLRSFLGRFLFHGDDVFKKVGVLSPGERSRVALAKLALQGSNLLVLDEPTNHLDPETQAIIADAFKTYPGTMLVVSHNPEFIEHLGIDRILILPSGKMTYYDKKLVLYYQKLNEEDNKR